MVSLYKLFPTNEVLGIVGGHTPVIYLPEMLLLCQITVLERETPCDSRRRKGKQVMAFLLPVSGLSFALSCAHCDSGHSTPPGSSVIACEPLTGAIILINPEASLSGMYITSWPLPAPWKSWAKSQERNVIALTEINELGLFLHLG